MEPVDNLRVAQVTPPAEGERYYLTVLITDLCGSSKLGRAMEIEHYTRLMAAVRKVWHDAAAECGGLVLRIQGDGALIIFGYPQANENDGWRAAEMALLIHERVAQLTSEHLVADSPALHMRTAIHSGIALMTEGDIERGRFDLNGDVINTAAHLQHDAEPGAVLASLSALGPHDRFFELASDPRPTDCMDPDLKVVQVLRRRSLARRFDAAVQRGLVSFVGREDAFDFLQNFLDVSGDPASRCAVIQGGAGMGKTRLIEEWIGRLPPLGRNVLRGYCENLGAAEVLQPFAQMLDNRPAEPNVDVLLERFSAACAKEPPLMFIDDWQWADDASRQLLVALLSLRGGPRVVLACRPRDDGAEWVVGAQHLHLRPFELHQTEQVVRRLLPLADPFLASRIHQYAGGVPLFIEELCHSASAQALSRDFERPGVAQTWLNALVASRLARLPAEQAAVVRAAAVIGNVVPHSLLSLVCDPAPTKQLLERLAEADFLYPDERPGTVRFKHGITRDVAYESIGLNERMSMHRRIESALLARAADEDTPDKLETLAHHARGSGQWERAARFGEQAGDRAGAAFAMDRARQHYRAALDAVDRLPDRGTEQRIRWCALANKLGSACIYDPLSLPDELAVFERAVAQARQVADTNLIARCLYWLGYLCYGLGRFRDGTAHARDALRLARECGDVRLASQIEATLGQILAAACQYDEALTLMNRALDHKRSNVRPGGGLAVGSVYTLACKASVLADRGEFEPARAAFEEAMQLLGDSAHPVANSTRNWIAIGHAWQGRWAAAERIASESAAIATNTRALLLLAVSRAVLGYVRWGAGEPAGIEQLRESVQWITARRSQFFLSLFGGWLVDVAAAGGDWDEVRRAAAQVLNRTRQGERLGEAAACRGLARRAAARQRHGLASQWLRRAEASAMLRRSAREAALNHFTAAELLSERGLLDEAEARLAIGLASCNSLGMAAPTLIAKGPA